MIGKNIIIYSILIFLCIGCNKKNDQNITPKNESATIAKQIVEDSASLKQKEIEEQILNASKYLVIKNDFWRTDEYYILGKLDISIQNKSEIDYRDVVILIKYYAESGTFLSKQTKTLYKIFPKGKTVTLEDVNTGSAIEDAYFGVVSIISATPDK